MTQLSKNARARRRAQRAREAVLQAVTARLLGVQTVPGQPSGMGLRPNKIRGLSPTFTILDDIK